MTASAIQGNVALPLSSKYTGPGTPLRTTGLWLRTMEKGLGESELIQDHRVWCTFIRDAVNSIGDAGSIRPG